MPGNCATISGSFGKQVHLEKNFRVFKVLENVNEWFRFGFKLV